MMVSTAATTKACSVSLSSSSGSALRRRRRALPARLALAPPPAGSGSSRSRRQCRRDLRPQEISGVESSRRSSHPPLPARCRAAIDCYWNNNRPNRHRPEWAWELRRIPHVGALHVCRCPTAELLRVVPLPSMNRGSQRTAHGPANESQLDHDSFDIFDHDSLTTTASEAPVSNPNGRRMQPATGSWQRCCSPSSPPASSSTAPAIRRCRPRRTTVRRRSPIR